MKPLTSLYCLPCIALCLLSQPAAAMSGEDITGKLTADARAAYIVGTVEMAMWQSTGNDTRIKCIDAWFFGDNKTASDEIADLMLTYPDKPAAGLLKVWIDRKCGAL